MYAQSVRFTCTALKPTGKKGVLNKDEYGYRTMPIGALNCFNSAGEYYTSEQAKNLFERSSSFMRRVSTGCLKSEEGHPRYEPGMSEDQYLRRVLTIVEANVCAHIADVWLDFKSAREMGMGDNRILIMGKVKPSGPHGAALEESFNNPHEDVCFSIRAFTEDKFAGGVNQRSLVEIVTFDRVGEPGINSSRKYKAPALETREPLNGFSITEEKIRRAVKPVPGMAMESMPISPESLLKLLGMQDIRKPPAFMGW